MWKSPVHIWQSHGEWVIFHIWKKAIHLTKICTTVFVLTLIVVVFILQCRQPNIRLQHIFTPQLLCWSQDRTHPLFLIPCPQCYRERRVSHLQQGRRPHCWLWLSGQQACIWAWAFSQSERKLAAVQELLLGFLFTFQLDPAWQVLTKKCAVELGYTSAHVTLLHIFIERKLIKLSCSKRFHSNLIIYY